MSIEIRRAAERFVTTAPGRVTRHSFSFGSHYDPANIAFGELVCHNDDLIDPGFGYDDHPHRDVEIVTWVLAGALSHRDSAGRSGVTTPGTVQVMSAGDGVVHAETVEPGAGVTRFVQTWVRPDLPGGAPSYAAAEVGTRAGSGPGWVPVASGSHPDAATRIGTRGATLWVAELSIGDILALPDAPSVHLFIATGAVTLEAGGPVLLREADAGRLHGENAVAVSETASQLLAWTFA